MLLFLESDACLPKYLGVKGYFKTSSLVFSALAAHLFAAIVSSRCLLSANIHSKIQTFGQKPAFPALWFCPLAPAPFTRNLDLTGHFPILPVLSLIPTYRLCTCRSLHQKLFPRVADEHSSCHNSVVIFSLRHSLTHTLQSLNQVPLFFSFCLAYLNLLKAFSPSKRKDL